MMLYHTYIYIFSLGSIYFMVCDSVFFCSMMLHLPGAEGGGQILQCPHQLSRGKNLFFSRHSIPPVGCLQKHGEEILPRASVESLRQESYGGKKRDFSRGTIDGGTVVIWPCIVVVPTILTNNIEGMLQGQISCSKQG